MALHRPVSRRARGGGGRRSRRPARVLLRRVRGWRLEDERRRHLLGERVRRFLQDGRGGRRRRGRVRSRTSSTRGWARARSAATSPTATASTARPTRADVVASRASPTRGTSARCASHPRDPDLVYVAALGPRLRAEPRARRVPLPRRRARVGAGALRERAGGRGRPVPRPRQPAHPLRRVLGDAAHAVEPQRAAGPDSGLWRSTDGGDTWEDLSGAPGFPAGLKGKIGVAVSPARTERVWAIVEAEDGGLFRSDDGGATWQRINEDREPPPAPLVLLPRRGRSRGRRHRVRAEHQGVEVHRRRPHLHAAHHAARRQPRPLDRPARSAPHDRGQRRRRLRLRATAGASWSTIYNQPTAQFYHVATDTRFPYRVYGTQQDNTAMSVPSRSYKGAILVERRLSGGQLGERAHRGAAGQPRHRVLGRGRQRAGRRGRAPALRSRAPASARMVTVWPEVYFGWGPKDLKYRFQWTFPILLSPHDPNILYAAGNVVFRSTDDGASWEAISPDLTRGDPSTLEPSGGPITKDTTGAEHYAHRVRPRRIAAPAWRALGGLATTASCTSRVTRGGTWTRDHAAGPAGVGDGLHHRAVAPRPRAGLPGGHALQARRHAALSLQDGGLRRDLDAHHRRHSGRRLHPRDPRGPRAARTALRRNRDRRLRLVRRRRVMAVAATEPAGGARLRPRGEGAGSRGRHPRPLVLDPGRPHAAPSVATDELAQSGAHLFTPRPAYRLVAPINSGTPTGPGKNYMVALGYAATFTETTPGARARPVRSISRRRDESAARCGRDLLPRSDAPRAR